MSTRLRPVLSRLRPVVRVRTGGAFRAGSRVRAAVWLRLAAGLALAAPLALVSVDAQQRPAQGPPPTFKAEVDYVEVDAIVTGQNGAFARELSRDDFELREDGVPQEISTFGLVDLPHDVRPPRAAASGTAARRRVAPDVRSNTVAAGDGRVFVLVLDDLHTNQLRAGRVKTAARQFIERYLGPHDLASVVHTSGADVSQDFTPDAGLLLASVDRFQGRKLRSATLEGLDQYNQQVGMPAQTSQADIRMNHATDPRDTERARQAQNMLLTLQRLGTLLADTHGRRKAIVLFSEGIDYDIENAVVQNASGLSAFANSQSAEVADRIRQVIGTITRANVAIYAIDPRGITTTGDETIEVNAMPGNPQLGLTPGALQDELLRAQTSLRTLADETGGVAAVNSNDFSSAFDRILRDNSTYYVLGYHSTNTRADGRFRKIELRLKRPGLQVVARKGYLAPSAKDSAAERALLSASVEPSLVLRKILNNPLPAADVPLVAFAAPFKGPGAGIGPGAPTEGSVLFGLEVAADRFRFKQEDGLYADTLEAAVVAVDRAGAFHEGDRYSITLRLKPETYDAVRANGVRLLFRLALPPGRYQLRAAAHESGTGATGSVYYDVQVPDFRSQSLALSGLVLTSTRAAATPTPRPDPKLETFLRQPPTGAREFTPDDGIAVVCALYRDPTKPVAPITVTTTISGEDGQVRFRSARQVSEEDLRAAPDGYGYGEQAPLADLAPGTYVLRVHASSAVSGVESVVRELPFTVRPAAAASAAGPAAPRTATR